MVSSVHQFGADWSGVLKALLQLRLVWREFLPPGDGYGTKYIRYSQFKRPPKLFGIVISPTHLSKDPELRVPSPTQSVRGTLYVSWL